MPLYVCLCVTTITQLLKILLVQKMHYLIISYQIIRIARFYQLLVIKLMLIYFLIFNEQNNSTENYGNKCFLFFLIYFIK